MATIEHKRGARLRVRRRGKEMRVIVVGVWAPGEGEGYACRLPDAPDVECFDVPARAVLGTY